MSPQVPQQLHKQLVEAEAEVSFVQGKDRPHYLMIIIIITIPILTLYIIANL